MLRDYAIVQRLSLALLLRFPQSATGFAALPWELLWDEHGPLLLSRGTKTALIRYFDLRQALSPVPAHTHPLRILAIMPFAKLPESTRSKAREASFAAWQALVSSGHIEVEELDPATPEQLVERLQRGPPVDIVHFYGHGRYLNDQGALLFDQADGGEIWLDATQLATVPGSVRLLVLNACQSSRISESDMPGGLAFQL